MKINLETIFRLLIPKYYNRLTWYLIGGVAVPLLSCPLWINFVNIVLEECQYPIIKMESNIIAGLIVLISSLTYLLPSAMMALPFSEGLIPYPSIMMMAKGFFIFFSYAKRICVDMLCLATFFLVVYG